MVIRFILLFILLLSRPTGLIAQGLNFDDEAYKKVPQKRSFRVIGKEGLPAKVDLSPFAPSVASQDKWNTCVGFSTAYYARTILEAVNRGLTNRDSIDALRFSPSFMYNAIKDADDDQCQYGSEIDSALTYMRERGVAYLTQKQYPDCEANDPALARPDSRIMDYIRLFGLLDRSENVVQATKKALAEMTPVIVGIQTTPSLKTLGFWGKIWQWILGLLGMGEEQGALWKPEDSNSRGGGHAICLVGYDDTLFGGAFQAVNSWGDSWGDDGFFWIRYQDYSQYTKYGYQAYLPIQADSADVTLSAHVSVQFATFVTDNEVPFLRSLEGRSAARDSSGRMVAYTLRDAQPTGTNFKFTANVDRLSYVYVLAASDQEPEARILFPVSSTVSPIIGPNTQLLLPSEDLLYTLVGEPGTEYWLFLFSEKELDIEKYAFDMNEVKGTFPGRTLNAFGKDLVSYQQVGYDNRKMGFVLRGKHEGHIVPLLISFAHKKVESARDR